MRCSSRSSDEATPRAWPRDCRPERVRFQASGHAGVRQVRRRARSAVQPSRSAHARGAPRRVWLSVAGSIPVLCVLFPWAPRSRAWCSARGEYAPCALLLQGLSPKRRAADESGRERTRMDADGRGWTRVDLIELERERQPKCPAPLRDPVGSAAKNVFCGSFACSWALLGFLAYYCVQKARHLAIFSLWTLNTPGGAFGSRLGGVLHGDKSACGFVSLI